MKKVIDGKLYNTETATELARHDNGCSTGDFDYCFETLYKTSKGSYFIHGIGGPRSRYSRACGQNSWIGGEDIIPLTEDEAKKWCETHCNGSEYCEIFGEPEEA